MKCKIHGCGHVASNTIADEWECPACALGRKTTTARDNLGFPELAIDGRKANLINNRITPLSIGDQYHHRTFGTGMVTHISENNNTMCPIKMHFMDAHCFCYFNIQGMQYKEQDIPLIQFPYFHSEEAEGTSSVEPDNNIPELLAKGKRLLVWNAWDDKLITLARHIAHWSKDPSTKCGAVIVDDKKRVASVGFNGYARGIPDDSSLFEREVKYLKVIHAEQNAILFAQKDLVDHTLYVWPMPPCSRCASMIIQAGITRVVTIAPSKELIHRWGEQIRITEEMFEEASVELEYLQ